MIARAAWALVACTLVGCQAAPADEVVLDFERGQLRLAATNPTLVTEAGSYLAAMFFVPAGAGCTQLFDMTPEEMGQLRFDLTLPAVSLASSQAWPAHPVEGESDSHTFGKIEAWGEYAFVVMASRLRKGGGVDAFADVENDPGGELRLADGTVFAMGCTQETVEAGKRLDLKLTLYPAGIR